jgi:hypothetical protein
MSQRTATRTKYWWLWPDFYVEKDARDAAMMGIIACSLIAVVTGFTFIYRYYVGGDVDQLMGGVLVFVIYCVLGYGIFKMSRMAASAALILFLAEKIYTIGIQGKSLGIAPLLAWYLFQATRGVYWFKAKTTKPKVELPKVLLCPHCGAEYNAREYRQDAPEWHCPQCAEVLPKE